jgi:glucose-1-phosphate cytidylyltransferase
MIVGILAGGLGSRLSEKTDVLPKPMVPIGGSPVLWHIMKIYRAAGHREFAVALGYRGDVIKDYFVHYRHRAVNLTVDLATGVLDYHDEAAEDWTVHLLDTGLETMTGGRVKRLLELADGPMLLTYGDAVGDIDIAALVAFHRRHGGLATMTVVRPPARFGTVEFTGDLVARFEEKPQTSEGWINGGFFVLEPRVIDYIEGDATIFEHEPLEGLARDGQLGAYRHHGFWQPMDTLRDVRALETLWDSGSPPWRVW